MARASLAAAVGDAGARGIEFCGAKGAAGRRGPVAAQESGRALAGGSGIWYGRAGAVGAAPGLGRVPAGARVRAPCRGLALCDAALGTAWRAPFLALCYLHRKTWGQRPPSGDVL